MGGCRRRRAPPAHRIGAVLVEQSDRPIALIDCNNFYVSCERVFDMSLRRSDDYVELEVRVLT